MNLNIKMNLDNSAFGWSEDGEAARESRWGGEVARILRKLADKYDQTEVSVDHNHILTDYNGNGVGQARITK